MPVRSLAAAPATRPLPAPPGLRRRRAIVAIATVTIVLGLAILMAAGLARDGFGAGDALLLGLYVPNIAWSAFAAVTALAGLAWYRTARPRPETPGSWKPRERTAVLIPARNEDVAALASRIVALRRDLSASGLGRRADIFILSDSDDPRAIDAEQRLALDLATTSPGEPRVYYRRRLTNAQRKPGNIAEWVRRWGGGYAYMLVLDADSRMSARRIAALIRRMETRPRLGLIQTGVRLTGAETRFGRLQQVATRLYGPAFATGIAGWSGSEGNYWGHNALIRVAAFAAAAGLPRLAGRPPFGGDILSHDFIEAAWLRRAGWAVEIDPDGRGSAEGGPQTLGAYHKRDRRWCQGNLQHLRIVGARGLHPISRLHLASGIGGYLAAPLWLALVLAAILFGPSHGMLLPALGAVALILAQKAAGVALWLGQHRGARARGIILRLAAGELVLSTLLAPIIMLRQTVAVVSVLAGQDCGWKPATSSGRANSGELRWLEPTVALVLLLAVAPGAGDPWPFLLVLPIVLPLLAAPLFTAWLDLPRGERPHFALRLPAPLYAVQR